MQNPYNNYLKRQKQQPMNNFKEKVKNSLSGKTINNTTLPNTAQSNIQSNIQQKAKTVNPVNAVSPVTTDVNKVGTGALSGVSTPVETPAQVNTNVTTPNALETPLNASETPSDAGGAGLMSLSDVNSALALTPEATQGYDVNSKARSLVYNPLDKNAIVPGTGGMTQAEYEAEVKRKQEAGIALDNQELYNKYLNQSTPYKYAEQILQSQKEQADKNWQLQEQMFQQQQDALNKQYEQSKLEAENAYKQSVDTLNEQKYNQMEELNISGTNRGIQYSPQQLGLENVANINHNKNLVETSNKRNELLNKLQIEMNNSLAQLNMSHLQNYTDYQNKLNGYQNDYYNQLMNWNREDNKLQDERDWEQKLLDEKRKWEEAQAQKDKEFQQMMQELQNKFDKEMQESQNQFDKDQQTSQNNWQSGENALDRNHDITMADKYKSRSSYSSGGGSGYYSSGYSRSYNPYSRGYYNGWDSYDGGEINAKALEDEITQQAIDNKFKQLSTDVYNAVDTGGVYDLMERADIYSNSVSPMYDAYYGLNSIVDERLDNTRETALKHLVNKSIARSTNGSYNIGDTVYKHTSPLRQSYIDKVNNTKERTANKVYQKHSKNSATKFKSNIRANAESMHEKIMSGNSNKTSSKSSSKDVKRPNKITTKYQTSVQKVNSSKTNKSNSKTTTKKTTTAPKKTTTTKNTKYQTSTQKLNSSKKNTSSKTNTSSSKKVTMTKKTNSSSSAKKYTTSTQKVSSSAKKTSSSKTTKKESFLSKLKKKITKK